MLRYSPRYVTATLTLLISVIGFGQTEASLHFKKADRQIIRLRPSSFPQLPLTIRQELNRRGCTIPQLWGEKTPHNVIKGSFIEPTELDWAVLCSVNRTSIILVFPNASISQVRELAREADRDSLQSEGGTQIGYSRQILPIGPKQIRQYQTWGGEASSPFPMNHQGIEDAFVGKSSAVLYFYQGKWRVFTGAD